MLKQNKRHMEDLTRQPWSSLMNSKGQVTDDVYNLLDNHNIEIVKVPPNCMDHLQPMDLSINKSVKDYLEINFRSGILVKLRRATTR